MSADLNLSLSAVNYAELLRLTLPEITVALAGLLLLTLDITALRKSALKARLGVGALIASVGCLASIHMLTSAALEAHLADGMFVVTPLTRVVQMALVALAILTVLLSTSARFTNSVGEYLALILFATVAMMFLVATQNLLLIFVALEFLSLSLYVLTGFDKRSRESAEGALKYFLFGGMSAGFLLFGMSLLYGVSGSIELPQIAAAVSGPTLDPLLLVAIVMVAIGFGFKVAAAPFHLWAPDAYQGAPTVSAGFIASSSKVASFFVFGQVVTVGLATAAGHGAYGAYAPGWVPTLCVIAALSMVVGNLAAIAQTSVRRLLAYSAIGHAGYMLLGLIAHTPMGTTALIYYVITYAVASLGAFGVLGALEAEGVDKIADLAGLSRRAPELSLCMLIFLLSLAGIPPLAGFFGKFYIFAAVVDAEPRLGLLWLVVLAVATSAVSLYYYLRVLKQIYVAEGVADAAAIDLPLVTRVTVWALAALVVLLGCVPGLLLRWIGA
ncbi:MAG TPA: NADH-quinone oxidoreductase subunit N [Acidobacteriaceae bacterium]|jgi:NADH-quinone oxidoreductase subunit N|nr:NADH-quinone oxidoreductase subunit N [Acidobacteriaceae bacterium]